MNYKITRMKKINIKLYLLPALFLYMGMISAQHTGIGTRNPSGTLEINTTGDDVYIDNTGKIGLGVSLPKVAIDLRNGTNQSFAVGTTTQTATAAGAGALRYNPTPAIGVKGYMEYSDGTKWITIYPYGKPRIFVMAEKTTNNVTVFETGAVAIGDYTQGLPMRSSSYLTNWTQKLDSDSGTDMDNFNPTTGEFIAPRAGIYVATFTFALESNEVNTVDGNQIEAIWEVRNASNTVTQRVKTASGFPMDTGSYPALQVMTGAACTVSVYLNAGDKLRPFAWADLAWNPTVYSTSRRPFQNTGGYNVLTIVEQ